jgi:TonB family protein
MHSKALLCALIFAALGAITAFAGSVGGWIPARVLGMEYPREAKFARISGTVQVSCSIQDDGTVSDVSVLSGHPVLARHVKTNIERWSFKRASVQAKLHAPVVVTYVFRLEGSCNHHVACNQEFWYELPDRVVIISELPNINYNRDRPNGRYEHK